MIRPAAILAALVLAAGVGAGCDDGGACAQTGTDRAFGACCAEDTQCAAGLCFAFGDGSQLCTLHCVANSDCPEGAQGRKCNRQGVCRP
ncbi:MAG: hypothetical protein HY905_11510 [Deltaproteobacteria bacterium]|nr:hypothetical protein [Deltaproteobacteria bacterium]